MGNNGRTIKIRNAVIGALAAVSVIAAGFAIPTASAETQPKPGSFCTPADSPLGGVSNGAPDPSVATWVGRDMYVAGKPKSTTTLDDSSDVPGSYAVEAEGLAIINGKLVLNPLKPSWSNMGFRFGAAGLGSQIRPQPIDGSQTALAIADVNSGIDVLKTGRNGVDTSDGKYTTASVGAWARGGFVGNGRDNVNGNWTDADQTMYNAKISGPFTTIKDNTAKDSIVGASDQNNSLGDHPLVSWEQTDVLKDINGVDYSSYQDTGKDYTNYIQSLSKALDDKTANGKTVVDVAPSGDYWRNKYNREDVNYKFIFNDNHKEKLITFTGDGVLVDGKYVGSKTQVFDVKASDLSSRGYAGVSYAFDAIPVGSSVVVNVVNDDGSPADVPIDFHNGWRFWWNGLEIGNGYTNYTPNNPGSPESAELHERKSKAYSVASKSIMWNFNKVPKLTIRGGSYNDQVDNGQDVTTDGRTNVDTINENVTGVGDDPAAALIGSVITPHGDFESHVTTNGRVWTGGDFLMYNPKGIKAFTGANTDNSLSASIIDMDQERHNYPWFGLDTSSCATISWNKVDDSSKSVAGTSWAIYNTLEAAVNQEESGLITRITDNDASDWASQSGAITLDGLAFDSTYYLVEMGNAPSANGVEYEENTNIYLITTGSKPGVYSIISKVYSSEGGTPSDDLLIDGKIVNKIAPKENEVSWGKYVKGDRDHILSGTSWTLKSPDGTETTINDLDTKVLRVEIKDTAGKIIASTGSPGTMAMPGNALTLTGEAILGDAEMTEPVYRSVIWSSENPSVALVDTDGRVWSGSKADGKTAVKIKAISLIDKSVSAEITVTPPAITGLVIRGFDGAILNDGVIEAQKRASVQLIADPNSPEVTWSTGDNTVATVGRSGEVTVIGNIGRSTVITAKLGDHTAHVTIKVIPAAVDSNIYLKNDMWSNNEAGRFDPNDLWITYCVDGDSCGDEGAVWNGVKTQPSNVYPGYNSVTLDDVPEGTEVRFYIHDTHGRYLNKGYNSGSNFSFVAGNGSNQTTNYTVVAGDAFHDGAPVVTRSVEAVTVGSSVDVENPIIDINAKGGLFTLKNLKPGSYQLWEVSSPDDYTINPTKYQFTVNADGTVKWGDPSPEFYDGLHWMGNVKNNVEWDKVDSIDDALLGESEWTMQVKNPTTGGWIDKARISDCVSDCPVKDLVDLDPDAGGFAVEGLTSGEYRLVESKAPDGYEIETDVYYYFTISMNSSSDTEIKLRRGDVNGPADPEELVEDNQIENVRKTGVVSWLKASSVDKNKLLSGSEWTLTDKATGESIVVTDCVIDETDSGKTCDGADKDPAAGSFRVEGLGWGTWVLAESKAPDGFQLTGGKWDAVIGKDGDEITLTVDLGKILNAPEGSGITGLPSTGDKSIIILASIVLAVVLAVTVLVVISRRKNR